MNVSTLGVETGTAGRRVGKKGKKTGKSLFFSLLDKAQMGSAKFAALGKAAAKSARIAGVHPKQSGLLEQLRAGRESTRHKVTQKGALIPKVSANAVKERAAAVGVTPGRLKQAGEGDHERLVGEALAYLKGEKGEEENGTGRKRKPLLSAAEDWNLGAAVVADKQAKTSKGKHGRALLEKSEDGKGKALAQGESLPVAEGKKSRVRLLKPAADADVAGLNGTQGKGTNRGRETDGLKKGAANMSLESLKLQGAEAQAPIKRSAEIASLNPAVAQKNKAAPEKKHAAKAGLFVGDLGGETTKGSRHGAALANAAKADTGSGDAQKRARAVQPVPEKAEAKKAASKEAAAPAPSLSDAQAAAGEKKGAANAAAAASAATAPKAAAGKVSVPREWQAQVDVRESREKVAVPQPRRSKQAAPVVERERPRVNGDQLAESGKKETKVTATEKPKEKAKAVETKSVTSETKVTVTEQSRSESGRGLSALRESLARVKAQDPASSQKLDQQLGGAEVRQTAWQAGDMLQAGVDQDQGGGFQFQRGAMMGRAAMEGNGGGRGVETSFAAVQAQAVERAAAMGESAASGESNLPQPAFSMLEDGMEEAYLIKPKSVTVKLKPAELGEVKITITREGDQMQAQIETQSSRTAKLIRDHQAELEQSMRERGMEFERFDVREERERQDPEEHQRQNGQQQASANGEDADQRREAFQERQAAHGADSEGDDTRAEENAAATTGPTSVGGDGGNGPLDITA
ncbi:flagellar hook-length control protein FliK [Acanthopleuribacter pedis]|uniref:Flagellar hook-length control protein FliK n=1 Tax=Acanthopleuribacter pedis TaxID=442870 RepID=A0A8J7U0Y5_9BACT|nr:flagellar hook-length control protein FliK [Acanthopleuribacter pedis]MBO1317583.1 flagellar hook-length control protein FliK [Acanthopleuribacter pedis]